MLVRFSFVGFLSLWGVALAWLVPHVSLRTLFGFYLSIYLAGGRPSGALKRKVGNATSIAIAKAIKTNVVGLVPS